VVTSVDVHISSTAYIILLQAVAVMDFAAEKSLVNSIICGEMGL